MILRGCPCTGRLLAGEGRGQEATEGTPAVSPSGRKEGIHAVAMGQDGGVLTETWAVEVTGRGDRGCQQWSSPAGASQYSVFFTGDGDGDGEGGADGVREVSRFEVFGSEFRQLSVSVCSLGDKYGL